MRADLQPGQQRSSGLVDVLDRVLDKGLVVAGDIKVALANVELLTIRIRLIICSIDKAQEIGLDWWRYDYHLSPGRQSGGELVSENEELRRRLADVQRRLGAVRAGSTRRGKRVLANKLTVKKPRRVIDAR